MISDSGSTQLFALNKRQSRLAGFCLKFKKRDSATEAWQTLIEGDACQSKQ